MFCILVILIRWAGHVAHMGRREAYTGYCWENLRGKRPLGRHGRRCEDNIKMDLQEVGCGGMDCFEMALDSDRWRVVLNAVMNIRVP